MNVPGNDTQNATGILLIPIFGPNQEPSTVASPFQGWSRKPRSKTGRRVTRLRLVVDQLEDRRLLAAPVFPKLPPGHPSPAASFLRLVLGRPQPCPSTAAGRAGPHRLHSGSGPPRLWLRPGPRHLEREPGGPRRDHRHRRCLRRPGHPRRRAAVRRDLPDRRHRRQRHRHALPPGGQSVRRQPPGRPRARHFGLGRGGKHRRGMGPRHRAGRQHPAGPGRQSRIPTTWTRPSSSRPASPTSASSP